MSSSQKTVLVTGSSSGIGKNLAFFLADEGWAVFAGVRKETDGAMLREYSSNIRPVIIDVVKPESVTQAIEEVRVAVGSAGLDVLVNCAGLACTGPIEFSPEADIMKMFDVNLFGGVRVTQAAMPLIRMGKPGRIINIGSIGSEAATPFLGFYQATKSAVLTMSETFRREVAQSGVKVVLIQPGSTKTEFEDRSAKEIEKYNTLYPQGTPCQEIYGKAIRNWPQAFRTLMARGVEPIVVVKRIYQAMTVKNPKNIYYDTWGSYFTAKMFHTLPYSWVDSNYDRVIFPKN